MKTKQHVLVSVFQRIMSDRPLAKWIVWWLDIYVLTLQNESFAIIEPLWTNEIEHLIDSCIRAIAQICCVLFSKLHDARVWIVHTKRAAPTNNAKYMMTNEFFFSSLLLLLLVNIILKVCNYSLKHIENYCLYYISFVFGLLARCNLSCDLVDACVGNIFGAFNRLDSWLKCCARSVNNAWKIHRNSIRTTGKWEQWTMTSLAINNTMTRLNIHLRNTF